MCSPEFKGKSEFLLDLKIMIMIINPPCDTKVLGQVINATTVLPGVAVRNGPPPIISHREIRETGPGPVLIAAGSVWVGVIQSDMLV